MKNNFSTCLHFHASWTVLKSKRIHHWYCKANLQQHGVRYGVNPTKNIVLQRKNVAKQFLLIIESFSRKGFQTAKEQVFSLAIIVSNLRETHSLSSVQLIGGTGIDDVRNAVCLSLNERRDPFLCPFFCHPSSYCFNNKCPCS